MHWAGKAGGASGRHLRTTLAAGVLIAIPVAVTVLIFSFLFGFFEDLLKEPLDRAVPGGYKTGMGIGSLLVIIYIIGLVATHVIGRRLLGFGHGLVEMIPVVRAVYRTARQATDVLSAVTSSSDGTYSSVVLVEFPGYGLRSIGLVTSKIKDQNGDTLLAVYMPTSPFPTSGFLVFLPPDQVCPTDISVDDAMKLIVSAGIMAPDKIVTTHYSEPLWVPSAPGHIYRGGVPAERPAPPESEASNQ